METSIFAPLGWGWGGSGQGLKWQSVKTIGYYRFKCLVSLYQCVSPHSWRWSGSETVWGVWSDCRVSCSSACTRDSVGRLWPLSAAGCCCYTGTGQIHRKLVNLLQQDACWVAQATWWWVWRHGWNWPGRRCEASVVAQLQRVLFWFAGLYLLTL